jgi:hypothetical protein
MPHAFGVAIALFGILLPVIAGAYTATGPCVNDGAWFVESRDGVRATFGPCVVPDEGSFDLGCDQSIDMIWISTDIEVPGPEDAAATIFLSIDGKRLVLHGSASFSAYLGVYRFQALLPPDDQFFDELMSGDELQSSGGYYAHLVGSRRAIEPVLRACEVNR